MKAIELKLRNLEMENKLLRIAKILGKRDFDINKIRDIKVIMKGE